MVRAIAPNLHPGPATYDEAHNFFSVAHNFFSELLTVADTSRVGKEKANGLVATVMCEQNVRSKKIKLRSSASCMVEKMIVFALQTKHCERQHHSMS